MFRIGNAIIAEEIAHVKFACDLYACKGACCVEGNAGAPVEKNEIPILERAWEKLKPEMRKKARTEVARAGLVKKTGKDFELSCTDGAECVFVTYDAHGVATCGIQKAWQEGRFDWPKPKSCHLFPLRISRIGMFDYVNYQYVPSICAPACNRAETEGIYLSDFLSDALVRKYGEKWYNEFKNTCKSMREAKIGVS